MTTLTVNLSSWADRWALAGISVLTVFVILVILVFVLLIFSAVARRGIHLHPHHVASGKPVSPYTEATEVDKVAIATTLHLYLNDRHDVESGILTINNDGTSPWQVIDQSL